MANVPSGCTTFTPEDQRRFDERLTPESRELVERLVQKALDVMAFNAEQMSRNGGLERATNEIDEFDSDDNKRKRLISEKEEQKQKLREEERHDARARMRAFAKYLSGKKK